MVELVVLIKPEKRHFHHNIVAEAVHPPAVVAITTTLAPLGIKIGGDKFAG